MQEENALLEEQNRENQEYINIARRKISALQNGVNDASIGIHFDPEKADNLKDLGLKTDSETGQITNYKERYQHYFGEGTRLNKEADDY